MQIEDIIKLSQQPDQWDALPFDFLVAIGQYILNTESAGVEWKDKLNALFYALSKKGSYDGHQAATGNVVGNQSQIEQDHSSDTPREPERSLEQGNRQ